MAGRHRRPPAWRRAVSTSLARLVRSRNRARDAAVRAEVVALRALVAELRADLETTLARTAELEAELAAANAATASADVEPVVLEPAPAGPALQLPLVRLALDREAAEPELTRDMALALSAPDRGEDTATTEIVLGDLPERNLLDPRSDRDAEPVDPAAAPAAETAGAAEAEEPVRRIA